MRVEVALPEIDGETVTFHWTQSEPNRFQHDNSFFFRYEGIDLNQFSPTLFYDLFLALQLRIFAAYHTPIDLVFATPVPAATVAFWTAYHGADLVTVSPITETGSYSPWAGDPPARTEQERIGVFFGGGKDSMALSCLLVEARGPEQVTLFQLTHPFKYASEEMDRLETRQRHLMMEPAGKLLGIDTQRAWTNYLSQIRQDPANVAIRPHLELYSVGLLPAMLARQIAVCSSAIERTAYRIQRRSDGSMLYHYKRSRPEVLEAQSRYYQRVLGTDLTIANFNYLFSSLMSLKLLAERYPAALEAIVMCVEAPHGGRWCYHCLKCVEYVFYSLRCGVIDDRFNYNRFFGKSNYVTRLIAYAERGVELTANGNAPWEPFIAVDGHFSGFCHSIAHLQPGMLKGRLGPTALTNLMMIKALFGNAYFPNVEMLATGSIDKLGLHLAREIATIASEHFTVVDDLPGPVVIGNGEGAFAYEHRMPLWGALADYDLAAK